MDWWFAWVFWCEFWVLWVLLLGFVGLVVSVCFGCGVGLLWFWLELAVWLRLGLGGFDVIWCFLGSSGLCGISIIYYFPMWYVTRGWWFVCIVDGDFMGFGVGLLFWWFGLGFGGFCVI